MNKPGGFVIACDDPLPDGRLNGVMQELCGLLLDDTGLLRDTLTEAAPLLRRRLWRDDEPFADGLWRQPSRNRRQRVYCP
ncbi:MAG: hypothetical protein J7M26_02140 [Armatimonadetes bacterium]|nr:hypothetical protein [Armatimonadota bacterium]